MKSLEEALKTGESLEKLLCGDDDDDSTAYDSEMYDESKIYIGCDEYMCPIVINLYALTKDEFEESLKDGSIEAIDEETAKEWGLCD